MIALQIQTSYIPWQVLVSSFGAFVAFTSLVVGIVGKMIAKRSKQQEAMKESIRTLTESNIVLTQRVKTLEELHRDERSEVKDRLDKIMDLFLNFKK